MRHLGNDLLAVTHWPAALPHRQSDAHGGSVAGNALHLDVAAVAAHVVLRDAESKARPLAALGGEERLEDMRQNIGRDARSGIANPQLDHLGISDLVGKDRDSAA